MARLMTHERFLERLIEVHKGEIVALETYKGSKHKIMFDKTTCEHDPWLAVPNNVLQGSGCPACATTSKRVSLARMSRRLSQETFEERLREAHGEEIVALEPYKGSRKKISFMHTECGHIWKALSNNILQGRGCPKCAKANAFMTQEDFEERLRKAHGEEIVALEPYRGSKRKIMFNKTTCKHPPWPGAPEYILQGGGCPMCGYTSAWKKTLLTEKEFQKELFKTHKGTIVSLEPYKGYHKKMLFNKLTCNHDPWHSRAGNVLKGSGCPGCADEKRGFSTRLTEEEFQEKLKKAHGGKVVSLQPYAGSDEKLLFDSVTCTCPAWMAIPSSVLSGTGCPLCKESKGEKFVTIVFDEQDVTYEREKRFPDCKHYRPLPFDFSIKLPDGNLLLIEVDGKFHRETVEGLTTEKDLKGQQKRDRVKDEYCKKNGHTLIRIPYYGTETLDDMRKILFATVGPLLGWEPEAA